MAQQAGPGGQRNKTGGVTDRRSARRYAMLGRAGAVVGVAAAALVVVAGVPGMGSPPLAPIADPDATQFAMVATTEPRKAIDESLIGFNLGMQLEPLPEPEEEEEPVAVVEDPASVVTPPPNDGEGDPESLPLQIRYVGLMRVGSLVYAGIVADDRRRLVPLGYEEDGVKLVDADDERMVLEYEDLLYNIELSEREGVAVSSAPATSAPTPTRSAAANPNVARSNAARASNRAGFRGRQDIDESLLELDNDELMELRTEAINKGDRAAANEYMAALQEKNQREAVRGDARRR
ncbi:MAG: hypothetical protein AAF747_02495 [Planctomycetota bacterium]